jgi:RNA polymerase sigma factor (sigma-70 family)
MAVIDGFKANFDALVRMLCRRGQQPHDAEDLAQDAFLNMLLFQINGGEVREPEAFLMAVAARRAIDHRRRARSHLYDGRPIEELTLLASGPSPEEEAASLQCLERAKEAIVGNVGPRAYDVIWLHSILEMTYSEIAKILGVSVATVERDLAKAIVELTSLGQSLKRS